MLLATPFMGSTVEYRALDPLYNAPQAQTLDELIVTKATEHGVSVSLLHQMIYDESSGNRYAKGDLGYVCPPDGAVPGEISPSLGLAQINIKCWHPNISEEEAYDPVFSVDFMAREIARGNCWLWSTCPPELARR